MAAGRLTRLARLLASLLDPRSYLQMFRLVHYYNYTHVRPRRHLSLGPGVSFSPNISLANAERITIGAGAHIGSQCVIWAGDSEGRVTIGEHALLGPEVFISASNYATRPGTPVMTQEKLERDIAIGADVWLGARVIVLPGVSIGDGCVVGAGSVVTRSLPPGAVAVGNPARIVKERA